MQASACRLSATAVPMTSARCASLSSGRGMTVVAAKGAHTHHTVRTTTVWSLKHPFATPLRLSAWHLPRTRRHLVAVSVVSSSAEQATARKLSVQIQKSVSLGQSLKLVGGHPSFGDWNPSEGLSLEWSEGDVWLAEVDLPPGTWEFKAVVVGGGEDQWEDGDNRAVEVTEGSDAVPLSVKMDFGDTAATVVEETAAEETPFKAVVETEQETKAEVKEEGTKAEVQEEEEKEEAPAAAEGEVKAVEEAEAPPAEAKADEEAAAEPKAEEAPAEPKAEEAEAPPVDTKAEEAAAEAPAEAKAEEEAAASAEETPAVEGAAAEPEEKEEKEPVAEKAATEEPEQEPEPEAAAAGPEEGSSGGAEEEEPHEAPKTQKAVIQVRKSVSVGQSLKVVGSHPSLGAWSAESGLELEWSEGDIWRAEVELPPGTWDFKAVVVGGGPDQWEDGENRTVEVPEGLEGFLDVSMDYGNTLDMTVEESNEELDLEEAAEAAAAGNAADAQAWIAAWRSKQEEMATVPQTEQDPAAGAREWIAAWRSSAPAAAAAAASEGSLSRGAPGAPEGTAAAEQEAEAEAAARAAAPGAQGERGMPQEEGQEEEAVGAAGWAAVLLGLAAVPLVGWSEWTLFSTGCGLPPGPGGLLGAAEGVSYLTVAGIALWSVAKKASTGKGLPPGPGGLLGAVEGLSFLVILSGAGVLGYQYYDKGYIPGALPGGACFGDAPVEPLDFSAVAAQVESLKSSVEPLVAQAAAAAKQAKESLPTQQEVKSAVETMSTTAKESVKPLVEQAAAAANQAKESLPTQEEVKSAVEAAKAFAVEEVEALKAASKPALEQAVAAAKQAKESLPTQEEVKAVLEQGLGAAKQQAEAIRASAGPLVDRSLSATRQMAESLPRQGDIQAAVSSSAESIQSVADSAPAPEIHNTVDAVAGAVQDTAAASSGTLQEAVPSISTPDVGITEGATAP